MLLSRILYNSTVLKIPSIIDIMIDINHRDNLQQFYVVVFYIWKEYFTIWLFWDLLYNARCTSNTLVILEFLLGSQYIVYNRSVEVYGPIKIYVLYHLNFCVSQDKIYKIYVISKLLKIHWLTFWFHIWYPNYYYIKHFFQWAYDFYGIWCLSLPI